jgi:hypothetical protein
MTGLMDIVPSIKSVPIQGTPVTVPGVSATGIASLLGRFPELKNLMNGKDAKFTAESLMTSAPTAIAAILAAGTGAPGNPKAEEIAAGLPLNDQLLLLEAIMEVTMPGGLVPFVERLTKLMAGAGAPSADGGKVPATN